MKKHWYLAPVLGSALLMALSSAHAHRSWLLPSAGAVDGKGDWVTFDAAVSEDYFHLGRAALRTQGLVITGPQGQRVEAANASEGKLRTTFDLQLPQDGTYRVSLVNEQAMASYKLGNEMKRWRGAAEALSKEIPAEAQDVRATITHARLDTYVTAGVGNDVALRPAGVGLEVLPVTHPEDFAPGNHAQFRVLLNGQPLQDATVSVIAGGVRYRGVLREQTFKTDAKGEFKVNWPATGMYAVSASYPPRAPQPSQAGAAPQAPAASAAPARRYTFTGTLEVLPQ